MPDTSSIQDALANYRAQRGGGATGTVAPPVAPQAPIGPTGPSGPSDPSAGIAQALATYRAGGAAPAQAIPKDNPSLLASFAKSLFEAPATIVARPFQAAAALAGSSNEEIDAATKKIPIVGGLIAPAPNNAADVKKDIGRAAETVALGTGAPIAGGALFGVGASLEQGNDLLSAQTAVNAALGAGGGKVLDWVGKPLLNAAGKVVGVITPKIIKDVASKGATAIQDFAASHQLLGGIAAKPAEAVASGLQKVDDAIGSGFRKGGVALKNVAADQFPHLNPVGHYTKVNEADFLRPTTVNEARFAKTSAVYNDAKGRGIDLEKAATDQGIIHDKIAEGGKYNTTDTVDNLREGNYKVSGEVIRPAIKEIEPGVRLIPIPEVRQRMLDKVNAIPDAQIKAHERETMIKKIEKNYADDGPEARAHPNGYSLTNLHDSRIVSEQRGKYKLGQSPSAELGAQLSREEGRVFADIFDKTIPESAGLAPIRKHLETNFRLADYLETLHNKKVPEGITKKAVRLFGRGLGGVLGSKIGGFPGFLVGSRGGDMLFNSFETLPNPIKEAVLTKAFQNRASSPVFDTLKAYLGEERTARLLRKALPAAGETSGGKPATLYATPGGFASPSLQEAVDVGNVASGQIKAPTTNRRLKSYLTKTAQAQDTSRVEYAPNSALPVINAGKKPKAPKKLTDIYLK